MTEPSTASEWRDEIHSILWSSNGDVQILFRDHFADELQRAVESLGDAYNAFKEMQGLVALDERTATVQMFLHVAIGSVLASLHHLVSGYPIAAGHMMRHYTEAIAMALLCSDEGTGVYRRYAADREKFPIDSAPTMLRRKKMKKALAESIGVDASAWETVLDIAELYDTLSHASALTLGFHMLFTEEGGLVLGSEFDPSKLEEYRSDVIRRRSAAESLVHVTPRIMASLPQKK